MTIKSIKEFPRSDKIDIDLTGPDGNAHVLLGLAKGYAEQLGLDWSSIHEDMTSGDYENLLAVFDREFGNFVNLYR